VEISIINRPTHPIEKSRLKVTFLHQKTMEEGRVGGKKGPLPGYEKGAKEKG
jgi:hypothetical protein